MTYEERQRLRRLVDQAVRAKVKVGPGARHNKLAKEAHGGRS